MAVSLVHRSQSCAPFKPFVVHRTVAQVLTYRILQIIDLDFLDIAILAKAGGQMSVHAGKICRQVELLIARLHLITHCRIEVHAVFIDQRLGWRRSRLPP